MNFRATFAIWQMRCTGDHGADDNTDKQGDTMELHEIRNRLDTLLEQADHSTMAWTPGEEWCKEVWALEEAFSAFNSSDLGDYRNVIQYRLNECHRYRARV